MAMQKIMCGGFVAAEISKINSNFTEIETDYAKSSALPTKTSDLTNDSGFITSSAIPTKTSQLTNDSNFVNQTQLTTAIAGIDIPTKTSDLTNDSNFVTTSAMNTALSGKVDTVSGKGLSTNDYTTAEKNKLAGLSAPTKTSFTAANWNTSGDVKTFTTAANSKTPSIVMRKNGTNYGAALVDIQVVGTNVVITSDEAFEGYIILV